MSCLLRTFHSTYNLAFAVSKSAAEGLMEERHSCEGQTQLCVNHSFSLGNWLGIVNGCKNTNEPSQSSCPSVTRMFSTNFRFQTDHDFENLSVYSTIRIRYSMHSRIHLAVGTCLRWFVQIKSSEPTSAHHHQAYPSPIASCSTTRVFDVLDSMIAFGIWLAG